MILPVSTHLDFHCENISLSQLDGLRKRKHCLFPVSRLLKWGCVEDYLRCEQAPEPTAQPYHACISDHLNLDISSEVGSGVSISAKIEGENCLELGAHGPLRANLDQSLRYEFIRPLYPLIEDRMV